MSCDPRDKDGQFDQLLQDIRRCKDTCTCPSLRVRPYYFEPNPETADEWRREGKYNGEIDPRVIFVCESPSSSGRGTDSSSGQRNWVPSEYRARRFWEVLTRHELHNSYITDLVKCGVRQGGQHSDAELEACIPFLLREIELIQPMIAVGVGGNATWALRTRVLPRLMVPPVLFQVTHYSMHREFPELLCLLSRLRPRTEWKR